MARQFLRLYGLLIVILVTTSWGQSKLEQLIAEPAPADTLTMVAMSALLREALGNLPEERWPAWSRGFADRQHLDLEMYRPSDLTGTSHWMGVPEGTVARFQAQSGELWSLVGMPHGYVLALRTPPSSAGRSVTEWLLAAAFYAILALAIAAWLWPLRRDLRTLDEAVANFGERKWTFSVALPGNSQLHPLAESFGKMARRIDTLIASHKVLSNAVAHEVKTPLSHMQFEIEAARNAASVAAAGPHLARIRADIHTLDALVTATLAYAVLDRAELALRISRHDPGQLVNGVIGAARTMPQDRVDVRFEIAAECSDLVCDGHLMETALRNLVTNAMRHARRLVLISVERSANCQRLSVEDDGPGIQEADRERIFEAFVQLQLERDAPNGFGLGLAMVRKIMEWHDGKAWVEQSGLGGARFILEWPAT